MGYTHYFRRVPELPQENFSAVVRDFKTILPKFQQAGILLAGWDGSGEPEITQDLIAFNGPEHCGHTKRDLGITWPAPDAGGVKLEGDTTSGTWFAGAKLSHRSCDGDCSHESFFIERIFDPEDWKKPDANGKYFTSCKTAYKPYDLAVTVALVIAKLHLGDLIDISSNGEEKDWFDAKQICQMELGYGLKFTLPIEA